MKRVVVVLAAGVAGALAAGLGVGMGVAAAGSGGERTGPERQPVVAAAVNDTARETQFVTVASCVLVNTQTAGGAFSPDNVRTLHASGTSGFPAQGGRNGGCAIPGAASAVQVVVTAVGASAKGSLRAGPAGATPATFMNYSPAFDVTSAGVIPLVNGKFRLQNLVATTHVRVDVQGYWIPSIWARVSGTGALLDGSRIVSSTRIDVGRFQLTADRDVSHCGITAQSTGVDQSDIWLQAVENTITVDVELPATANTQDDDAVYVEVTC